METTTTNYDKKKINKNSNVFIRKNKHKRMLVIQTLSKNNELTSTCVSVFYKL